MLCDVEFRMKLRIEATPFFELFQLHISYLIIETLKFWKYRFGPADGFSAAETADRLSERI